MEEGLAKNLCRTMERERFGSIAQNRSWLVFHRSLKTADATPAAGTMRYRRIAFAILPQEDRRLVSTRHQEGRDGFRHFVGEFFL